MKRRRRQACPRCGTWLPHAFNDCLTALQGRVGELEALAAELIAERDAKHAAVGSFAAAWAAQERFEQALAHGGDVTAAREAVNEHRSGLGVRLLPA